MSNAITNALFNAYDIKKTIKSNGLGDVKRVHSGTDNDDTLEDLITGIIEFLEEIDETKESEL